MKKSIRWCPFLFLLPLASKRQIVWCLKITVAILQPWGYKWAWKNNNKKYLRKISKQKRKEPWFSIALLFSDIPGIPLNFYSVLQITSIFVVWWHICSFNFLLFATQCIHKWRNLRYRSTFMIWECHMFWRHFLIHYKWNWRNVFLLKWYCAHICLQKVLA